MRQEIIASNTFDRKGKIEIGLYDLASYLSPAAFRIGVIHACFQTFGNCPFDKAALKIFTIRGEKIEGKDLIILAGIA